MKIAFYAPLKPPTHPIPSGDRETARLLIAALTRAGHEVELASRLRMREGQGDLQRQLALADAAKQQAVSLVRRFNARPREQRPQLWLTYHLYYKAPDWIGPRVADALGIPYVVVEASHAPKRAGGPWDLGHHAVEAAIRRADLLIALNPGDIDCLMPLVSSPTKVRSMRPFLDGLPYAMAAQNKPALRESIDGIYSLDLGQPWLIAVAMMRVGDKLASYRVLAEALAQALDQPWQLLVVGDGEARVSVERIFEPLGRTRVRYGGLIARHALPNIYAACDLFVWPAINEAFGMAILEAQAAGLPVLAGESPGVAGIVDNGTTGLLTTPGDAGIFARALRGLLDHPDRLTQMSRAALAKTTAEHGLSAAAERLDGLLRESFLDPRRRPGAAMPATLG